MDDESEKGVGERCWREGASRSLLHDNTETIGPRNSLSATGHIEFLVDVFQVSFDSML